jgi:hypothetical protein
VVHCLAFLRQPTGRQESHEANWLPSDSFMASIRFIRGAGLAENQPHHRLENCEA